MTHKKIGDELVGKLIGGVRSYADLTHNRKVIDQALDTAVAENRERIIALLVEFGVGRDKIAAAIRKGVKA